MTKNPRKKRLRIWLVSVLGALVVLAGAGELILRAVIPNIVAEQIREQLHLDGKPDIEVSLEGSALLPALVGKVGPITVEVPDVTVIEGISATVSVSADSVPFDPSKGDIEGARGTVTIPPQSIGPLIALVTQDAADSGAVSQGRLQVSKDIEAFGQETTLAVELDLAVDAGQVRIIPLSIQAAGFDLTAEQLTEVTGGSLDSLLLPQDVCISNQIPSGITLSHIAFLNNGAITLDADIAPGILSDPAQMQPGICEG